METKKCPKCEEEMEEGVIPTYKVGGIPPSFWVKKVSFLKGLENKKDIVAYRCMARGCLESYAK